MSEPQAFVTFESAVEPPEPMRGLQVPEELVDALDRGKRPRVTVTVNGHSWRTRVAIMRGRFLIGFSNANRKAAGASVGDVVEVRLEPDDEPAVVVEPEELTVALDSDGAIREAFDRLSFSRRRAHVHAVESAKRPDTRRRRVEAVIADLQGVDG